MPPTLRWLHLAQSQFKKKRKKKPERWQPLYWAQISRLWQLPHSCPSLLGYGCCSLLGVTPNMILCQWLVGNPSRSPGCRDNTAHFQLSNPLEPSVRCFPSCWVIQPFSHFSSSTRSWEHHIAFLTLPDPQRADADKTPRQHSALLHPYQLPSFR